MSDITPPETSGPAVSATDAFLNSVDTKSADPMHKRLLNAARGKTPVSNLEAELRAIASEIIHAN